MCATERGFLCLMYGVATWLRVVILLCNLLLDLRAALVDQLMATVLE